MSNHIFAQNRIESYGGGTVGQIANRHRRLPFATNERVEIGIRRNVKPQRSCGLDPGTDSVVSEQLLIAPSVTVLDNG